MIKRVEEDSGIRGLAHEGNHLDEGFPSEQLQGLRECIRLHCCLAEDFTAYLNERGVLLLEARDRLVVFDNVNHFLLQADLAAIKFMVCPLELCVEGSRRQQDDQLDVPPADG